MMKPVVKKTDKKRPYKPPRIETSEAIEKNALGSACNPNLDESEGCPKGW